MNSNSDLGNESIVGEIVYHSSPKDSYGKGIITNAVDYGETKAILSVAFSSSIGTKRFTVPNAFLEGRNLSTESAIVKKWLEKYTKYICNVCKQQRTDIKEIDGELVCSSCEKTFLWCHECTKRTNPARFALIINDDPYWPTRICRHCAPNFHRCARCNKLYSLPGRIKNYPKLPTDLEICGACLSLQCEECECCGEWVYTKNTVLIEEHIICQDCFDSQAYICPVCGKHVFDKHTLETFEGHCYECGREVMYEKYALEKVNSTDSFRVSFDRFSKLPTTDLMTRLHENYKRDRQSAMQKLSDPAIDGWLREIYERSFEKVKAVPLNTLRIDCYGIVLIIVHGLPSWISNIGKDYITASDFKKTSTYTWKRIDSERAYRHFLLSDGSSFNLWKQPHKFGAVTEYNKNFGMEFHGRYHVIEKDRYGDTSDFYIIGSITKK